MSILEGGSMNDEATLPVPGRQLGIFCCYACGRTMSIEKKRDAMLHWYDWAEKKRKEERVQICDECEDTMHGGGRIVDTLRANSRS